MASNAASPPPATPLVWVCSGKMNSRFSDGYGCRVLFYLANQIFHGEILHIMTPPPMTNIIRVQNRHFRADWICQPSTNSSMAGSSPCFVKNVPNVRVRIMLVAYPLQMGAKSSAAPRSHIPAGADFPLDGRRGYVPVPRHPFFPAWKRPFT